MSLLDPLLAPFRSVLDSVFRPGASRPGPADRSASRRPAARRTLRRVLAAVAAAGATMLLVWTFAPEPEGVPTVVTTREIPAGTPLTTADVAITVFAADSVPDAAFTEVEDVLGSTTASALGARTPLTRTAFVEHTPDNVPAGMVLMPLTVTDPAFAHVVRPGHHVRIFSRSAYTDPGAAAPPESAEEEGSVPGPAGTRNALVEDVVVTSVSELGGGAIDTGAGSVLVVTVTPEDAAVLAQHAEAGLSFALLPM